MTTKKKRNRRNAANFQEQDNEQEDDFIRPEIFAQARLNNMLEHIEDLTKQIQFLIKDLEV